MYFKMYPLFKKYIAISKTSFKKFKSKIGQLNINKYNFHEFLS